MILKTFQWWGGMTWPTKGPKRRHRQRQIQTPSKDYFPWIVLIHSVDFDVFVHVLVSNVLWNQTRIEPVSLGGQPTTEVSGAPPCHRGIQLSGRVADQTRVFVLSCSGSSKYLNQKWWLKTPRWTPFWISSSSSSLGQSRPSKTIWQIMQV